MKKVSKEKAEYKPGKLAHHCGPLVEDDPNYCRFFDQWGRTAGSSGHCRKVEGIIRAHYGCKLFEKHQ